MNGEPIRPCPKPVRAAKEPKRLRAVGLKKAARIAAGEERAGMKRGYMKKKPPRRLATEDAGRMEFARHGTCVGSIWFPGHICRGDLTASHERNPPGELPTGTGRKEDPRKTCRMCRGLHLDEWEARAGVFEGWTNEQRHDFMTARYTEVNIEWDALADEQREWWTEQEAINRKKRSEARRAAA